MMPSLAAASMYRLDLVLRASLRISRLTAHRRREGSDDDEGQLMASRSANG